MPSRSRRPLAKGPGRGAVKNASHEKPRLVDEEAPPVEPSQVAVTNAAHPNKVWCSRRKCVHLRARPKSSKPLFASLPRSFLATRKVRAAATATEESPPKRIIRPSRMETGSRIRSDRERYAVLHKTAVRTRAHAAPFTSFAMSPGRFVFMVEPVIRGRWRGQRRSSPTVSRGRRVSIPSGCARSSNRSDRPIRAPTRTRRNRSRSR